MDSGHLLEGPLKVRDEQLLTPAGGQVVEVRAHASSPPLASAYSWAESKGPSSVTSTMNSQPAP